MTAAAGGLGKLGVAVWPAYIGFCTQDPGPGPVPYGEPSDTAYQRGQIQWGMENGEIVGRAFVNAPKNRPLEVYTHQAFFSGPEGDCMVGKAQLSQPIHFRSDGVIEVYPITNPDLRMNKAQGIDY